MISKHSNDNASASGIVTIVAVFLLAGILLIANGFAADKILDVANSNSLAGSSATQLRYDVINLMVAVFRFLPILILISLGINRMIAANREFSEVAPLSTLSIGVAEMIFLNIVILAMTIFGGFGIDTVVNVMTSTALGADSNLYEIIQFAPNIFYGCMFLACIGVCIQFVLECVQVSDHSNSFTQ